MERKVLMFTANYRLTERETHMRKRVAYLQLRTERSRNNRALDNLRPINFCRENAGRLLCHRERSRYSARERWQNGRNVAGRVDSDR